MPKSKKSRKANTSKLGNMAKSRKAKRQKVPRLKLEDLPNELVIGTFSYLNMKDLNNCSQVSKRFRAIVNDEQGRRKEDLLKIIQDFQCFKCKKFPGPKGAPRISKFGFNYGDQSKRYLCENSHILCVKHKKRLAPMPVTHVKGRWDVFEKKCPCGSLVDNNPSESIAKKLQFLPWICQNYQWGCREVKVDAKNLESHHGECIFRKVNCPFVDDGWNDGCTGKHCFKDIFDHLNTVHKDDCREIKGKSNKWIERINIEGEMQSGDSWSLSKMTSTNGDLFGLVAKVEGYVR